MKVTRFDPAGDLIRLSALLWGPRGERGRVTLAFDPGAAITVIAPAVLDRLGYTPRDGEAITRLRSAVAEEPGYLIRVARLVVLGHEQRSVLIHAHDLPDGFGIWGLLGLDFLRQFNYTVRSIEGRILIERALPTPTA